MRLIDADKLRKPIYADDDNIIGCWMSPSEQDDYNCAVDEVWQIIKLAPAVDTVEVVRCGECLYHREKNKKESAYLEPNVIVCTNSNIFEDGCGFMWRTDFCSYGEREE